MDEDFLETFFSNTLNVFKFGLSNDLYSRIQILGLIKKCFQFLNRLYDITWFGAV
jgi:hypothetical protein